MFMTQKAMESWKKTHASYGIENLNSNAKKNADLSVVRKHNIIDPVIIHPENSEVLVTIEQHRATISP